VNLLLAVILIAILLGGVGWRMGGPFLYGGPGLGVVLLIIVLVLLLTGHI
jgi:hypothetical protein